MAMVTKTKNSSRPDPEQEERRAAAERTETALRRWKGAWLCSASERSRVAPDLWPTTEAAERDERLMAQSRRGGQSSA
jgi:hypothetical protein